MRRLEDRQIDDDNLHLRREVLRVELFQEESASIREVLLIKRSFFEFRSILLDIEMRLRFEHASRFVWDNCLVVEELQVLRAETLVPARLKTRNELIRILLHLHCEEETAHHHRLTRPVVYALVSRNVVAVIRIFASDCILK